MPGFDHSLFYQLPKEPAVQVRLSEQPRRGVPFDPSAMLRRANSTEEQAYNQGLLTLFKLVPDTTDAEGFYRFEQHHAGAFTIPHGIYAFVIVETTEGFDLRVGSAGHYYVAGKAPYVIAAGDLYFTSGFLSKITDQSGSYNTKSLNPKEREHRHREALEAMKAMGLPMDKFCAFEETTITLLFSAGRGYQKHHGIPAASMAKSQDRPCTDAAPRVRQPVP